MQHTNQFKKVECSNGTIIYEDKHRGKVWKKYSNLYDGPEIEYEIRN